MDLKEKAKNLPLSPGVYLMKDSQDEIIYVGKSKCLKNRVGSYFQNSKNRSPKVEKLVKNLKDFDYIVTDTEFEAFMMECKLIKKLKPRYNKLMKNPMSYTYIVIKTNEVYPSIEVRNNFDKSSNELYFGPYTSKNTVERVVEGIKYCFKINCSNPSKNSSACLNYSLGLCLGMCFKDSLKDEYNLIVHNIIDLLKGNKNTVIKTMEEKMLSASEKFDFEIAARYRDYIEAIFSLVHQERVIEFTEENKNILMIENLNDKIVKAFFIKGNKVIFSDKYNFENCTMKEIRSVIKESILKYFESIKNNLTIEVNKDEIDEAQIIYSYLKNSNCKYTLIPNKWLIHHDHVELNKIITTLLSFES